MKICVTGHRPNKLYGYDLNDNRWIFLKEKFKQLLVENNCHEAITGMALGVDTVFSLAVLELKKEGFNIKLHCAIPCKNYFCKWTKASISLYKDIISKADIVKLVSNEEYKAYLMQKRNEYMVNLADKIIVVWNGRKGGTENCIKYANKMGKEIISIDPFTCYE